MARGMRQRRHTRDRRWLPAVCLAIVVASTVGGADLGAADPQTGVATPANTAWALNAAFLVLLMPVGFTLLTCGLVQRKNAAHLVMLNLTAYVVAWLAYYAVGYAFQFGAVLLDPTRAAGGSDLNGFLIGSGRWGFLGGRGFFLTGPASIPGSQAFIVFNAAVMTMAGYVIVGAVCERMTFWAFVLCEIFIAAFLYPIFGCWVWGGGWLSQLGTFGLGHGYVDFAGSTVVHAVGGFAAMALSVILGPRIGKYGPRGEANAFPAHNIVFVVVGTLVLLFGWMGFNSGSTFETTDLNIARIALNTGLAAAGGSAAAIVVWYLAFHMPDISMACSGLVGGLVAISASCAFVGPNAALVIGILAGVLVCGGVLFNDRVLRVDDPCGTIPVHGYCGWLGALAVGIFADGSYGVGWNGVGTIQYLGRAGQGVTGLLHGDASQFLVQLAGATLSVAYAFGLTYAVFALVNGGRALRVQRDVELEGLDLPEFGMLAYPEEGTNPLE